MAGSDGRFYFAGFDETGRKSFQLLLPSRGHSVARRPGKTEAVVLARRPGTFGLAVDLENGAPATRFDCLAGRHFYGHGEFSPEGRYLFTTENDIESGHGAIGVRDAHHHYDLLQTFSSHGIGPHDIRLLSDGKTLVVANGGIRTHPATGRKKLNLTEMSPSLAYIDIASGKLLGDYRLARHLHQLSIRHLAVSPRDEVAVAMQYEGPAEDLVPLVGKHDGGETIALLEMPEPVLRGMRKYCGSAAIDRTGRLLGVSCPRGNLVVFWHLASGEFLDQVRLNDGCGIAAGPLEATFLITSGLGGGVLFHPESGHLKRLGSDYLMAGRWDNHLSRTE